MKTFSIQHALFPLLLLLSGSSYWFLQVRSSALQSYKDNQATTYPMLQQDHNSSIFVPSSPEQLEAEQKEGLSSKDGKEQEFQEDQDLLPDVQLLKFILDKSKEGLPVLRLPAFLYR